MHHKCFLSNVEFEKWNRMYLRWRRRRRSWGTCGWVWRGFQTRGIGAGRRQRGMCRRRWVRWCRQFVPWGDGRRCRRRVRLATSALSPSGSGCSCASLAAAAVDTMSPCPPPVSRLKLDSSSSCQCRREKLLVVAGGSSRKSLIWKQLPRLYDLR